MKKNKGFTLIEVLAVIVILGLIGVIIIPKVTESIKLAKEKKFIVSANNLIDIFSSIAIEKKANMENFTGCSYNFETSVTDCPEFQYSGVLPDRGSMSVDGDGNVTCTLYYNDIRYSCEGNEVFVDGEVESEYLFGYVSGTNNEQSLVIPKSGYYKLEVWGAQGGDTNGNTGGYGGYSTGFVWFDKGEKIYINVGGEGGTQSSYSDLAAGGYNGGGQGGKGTASNYNNVYSGAGGGGATHIALKTGILSFLSSDQEKVLIVAGGGGGAGSISGVNGGSGGGFIGVRGSSDTTHTQYYSTGGSQKTGGLDQSGESSVVAGSFGLGSNFNGIYGGTGGGGGYYGGGGTNRNHSGAGGGSGYIGNSRLFNAVMYCYGCTEDGNDGTRTISTTGSNKDSVNCPDSYSSSPLSNCAKSGDGYAIITYVGQSLN